MYSYYFVKEAKDGKTCVDNSVDLLRVSNRVLHHSSPALTPSTKGASSFVSIGLGNVRLLSYLKGVA